jgi:uracil-DNA glycosylase family 4
MQSRKKLLGSSNGNLDSPTMFVAKAPGRLGNTVLCNPRTSFGNNDAPTLIEIRGCSGYLKEILEIVRPKYIVALGTIALASLNVIKPHNIRLSKGLGKLFPWNRRLVYPLFHPGPRAFVWQRKAQRAKDHEALGRVLEEV